MNDLFIIRVEADTYEDFTDQELVIVGKEKAEGIYQAYAASREYLGYDNDEECPHPIFRIRLYSAKVDTDGIIKPDTILARWRDKAKWFPEDEID